GIRSVDQTIYVQRAVTRLVSGIAEVVGGMRHRTQHHQRSGEGSQVSISGQNGEEDNIFKFSRVLNRPHQGSRLPSIAIRTNEKTTRQLSKNARGFGTRQVDP